MNIEERETRQADFTELFTRWKAKLKIIKINFNPVVALASFLLVLAVVMWILHDDKSEEYAKDAQTWITKNFTWLYVSTTMAWVVFLFVVYFFYGHIKLGAEEEEPEHENFAYYAMLLTCGISSPIFYSGVADTIGHYNNEHVTTDFYSRDSGAARAQHAMSVTLYMWGLHGFAGYAVFGLIIGILTHRKGLPLTLRTCFYPLLGRFIFGRFGDFVDTLCISSILYGVSVSLVIGAKFLNSGFHLWNSDIDTDKDNQLCIIWGLTLLSTISVISGLNIGIKKLSQLCVMTGSLVCLILLTAYKTAHILNVIVQSVGYYTQYLVGFGLYTAAFQQRGLVDGGVSQDISSEWMNSNTIFYWGWWISWSPFVGLFIAKISRGRTVKEIIWYSFILPVLTLFVWLVTFGSIGLDMEMQAINLNVKCPNQTSGRNEFIENLRDSNPATYNTIDRLSCYQTYFQTFRMFVAFEDISEVLRVFTVIGAILFFVTSSDSASLIIDCVSSNGKEHPPVIQRVFWALCEGLVASALLQHSAENDLNGLQAFAIMAGFPLTFLLCFCCYSLWRVLKHEPNWRIELEKVWETPIPTKKTGEFAKNCLISVFAPWFKLGKISKSLRSGNKFRQIQGFVLPALMFNMWIFLLFLRIGYKNVDKIGWSSLIIFLFYGANIREKIRSRYEIEGSFITDLIMMIFYPFTILQMEKQVNIPFGIDGQHGLRVEQLDDIVGNSAGDHTINNNINRVSGYINQSFRNESTSKERYGDISC